MANENKQAVIAAIWENPEPAFNCRFRPSGRYLINERNGEYNEQGKIRLAQTPTGDNIIVFYNGSSREEKTDVFTHLERYVLHTAGFAETLKRLADIYGLSIKYSEEQRRKMSREALAREVCPCLIESLRKNPTGQAGRYITETRGLRIDAHFGELTPESLKAAKEHLRNRGFSYSVEDLQALGLTEERARNGYNVVIPYYNNGNVIGFILRNTTNNPNAPKYLYSQDMGRNGYCDRLRMGKPVFVVEGQMDAVRLIQAYANDEDAPNVLAMGGAKISDSIAALLKRHNIDVITYVPDVEYNDKGERKTDIINAAIQAFQAAKVEDEPTVKTLFVSELPTPEGVNLNGYKIDADTYGKTQGNDVLACSVESNAVDWYIWELGQLEQWERTADSWDGWNIENNFRDKFRSIYSRAGVWERQPIRDYIKNRAPYGKYGVTPQVLTDEDALNSDRDYKNDIKAIYTAFTKAVESGANPVVIAEIAARLNDVQTADSRDSWDASVNRTCLDRLARLRQQPANLSTKWVLGTVKKGQAGKFRETERIEFTPSDITVFCAPTSHGKTTILFQAALDMVRDNPNKLFLYVSCEESEEQLQERALNAFIPIPNTENGKDAQGNYCFMSRTRRKTIQAALFDDIPPQLYMNTSGHFDSLKRSVEGYLQEYVNTVDKRLKLIHTDASTESICKNITRFVRQAQEQGVEVGGVFVDYMQLLNTDNTHFSRHDELKEICKTLSNCAKKNAVPVVIAAQLNREIYRNGIDDVSVANIGEGADIERIAKDVFLVWQVDKTPLGKYNANGKEPDEDADSNTIVVSPEKVGIRANRIFTAGKMATQPNARTLKTGYIYVEHLKARYGQTGGWGLFPYDGESGTIGENDINKMAE